MIAGPQQAAGAKCDLRHIVIFPTKFAACRFLNVSTLRYNCCVSQRKEIAMGLDMYLHAKKYVEKINWQALQDNSDLSYDSPEAVFSKWNEIVEVADMKDIATDIYGVNVEVTCAYWRKSNMIHKWFVDNVQGGEDNCGEYYVSHDKLRELRETCRQALFAKDPSLLPPQAGFFFGSYDIDEWYWRDIKETIKKLDRLFKLSDFDKLSFYYSSSW